MDKKPLITVIILSYNNYEYILQAIRSVIDQKYENIQLIISDDCSKFFDKQKISEYVNKYKSHNIKNLIIHINEKNLGTVKNINCALKYAEGKYIKLLAADDELYDSIVLTEFVQYLEKTGLLIATSRYAVCDEKLQKIKYLHPDKKNINFIKNLSSTRLYRKLAVGNIIGGVGVCMRRDLIYKYGLFDERYILTEDLPTWLILLRNGIKFGYIDNITVKYRINGVSNGVVSPSTKILRNDLIKIIDNEISPNRNILNLYEQREVKFIRINMLTEKYEIREKIKMLLFIDVIIYRKLKTFNSYLRRLLNGK